jgi:hypothetical protein
MIMKTNIELLLDKKLKKPKEIGRASCREYCQCYSGLKRGYPTFSDNLDDARSLTNIEQFKKIQYGTSHNLEMIYV